ncbi:MAG: UTP--glucose-1-phosphate uridylyltransferase [Thermoanaerobaculales bacterium]|nr:UTP--glucose-1-phosphate uridylyltransferase [Thermoanaerobaculales bacterium]
MDESLERCVTAMNDEGLPELTIRTFCLHLERLRNGETGKLSRNEIDPVAEIPETKASRTRHDAGIAALDQLALVKLNGGLGTSMGLERAKSLLPVREGLSFLDLIARQVLALRRTSISTVPIFFMNSFRTEEDTLNALAPYPDLATDGLPLGFLQHKVPKILREEHLPAHHGSDPELDWCPPGHGDVYTALETTGLLDDLLAKGINFVFMSNADNVGAVFDAEILGYMVENDVDFLMEAADRTDADRKGGHLCRLKNGRLALRESAQCPGEEQHEFRNIDMYRYFNTNNIWLHLPSLKSLLHENQGVLPLSTIVNHKTLDPRDPGSALVIQLETAMGSAISLFPKAAAIRVPRQRFSPVKTTNDLLGVRSDAYELTDDFRVRLHRSRFEPPTIELDSRYYKAIDDFDRHFPEGAPSLRRCSSLKVTGDVVFESGVTIIGDVAIQARSATSRIAANTEINSDFRVD